LNPLASSPKYNHGRLSKDNQCRRYSSIKIKHYKPKTGKGELGSTGENRFSAQTATSAPRVWHEVVQIRAHQVFVGNA